MNIFSKRHLALFCAIFAATSLCGCFCSFNIKSFALLLFAALILIFFLFVAIFKKRRAKVFKAALCFLFAFLALASQLGRVDLNSQRFENDIGFEKEMSLIVKQVNVSLDFLSAYEVEIYDTASKSASTKAILEFEYNPELSVGDIIEGRFTVNNIESYSETPSYYKAKGIYLYLNDPQNVIVTDNSTSASIFFRSMNNELSHNITEKIDGEAGKLLSALFLGNKDLLDDSTVRNFRRAGISHLLAISGTHLSILVFFIDYLLKKIRVNKTFRGGIVLLLAVFYLFLTGCALSTLRAFIMTAMIYIAFIVQDENDLLTSLFFSLFVILLAFPNAVYDIGLWLSFLAVLGIFVAQYFVQLLSNTLYTKLSREKRKDKYAVKRTLLSISKRKIKIAVYITSCVLITLFVNVFICIPVWLYFSEISLISIISNIVVAPLVSVILIFAPLFVVTGFFVPLNSLLAFIIENIGTFVLEIISLLSSFSKITISTNYPFVGIIAIFLAITTFLCLACNSKRKWLIFMPALMAGLAFSCCLITYNAKYKNMVQIDYESYGESEMLILKDGKQYSIIDISSGGTSYPNNAYLKSLDNCATEIDSFVFTHYHNYHLNSVKKLMKKAIIHQLFLPYPQNTDEYYYMSALVASAQENGIDVTIYDASKEIKISANTTITLSPRYTLKRSTHPTFFMTVKAYGQQFSYFSESVFETYELTKVAENAYAQSDFAVLGTHGPITKNDIMLEELCGEQVVICADQNVLSALWVDEAFKETVISDKTSHRIILNKIKIR